MITYMCDVCGKPMPAGYERPKRAEARSSLMTLCRWDDACASCRNAMARIDVTELLRGAWRSAAKDALEEPDESAGARKRAARDRLAAYRASHPLGSLKAVAKRMGRGWTDEDLRQVLTGEKKLAGVHWDLITPALDKVEAEERQEAASA